MDSAMFLARKYRSPEETLWRRYATMRASSSV